ncbi:DNA-directed RNA polymerase subunit beta [Jeotgalibaca sp. MA1X17-3]|uniref:DNA-directed RNA polymerase subunit beta n=1 Tax=Jeotgalibaca sp. MA1X17-3 TaxID=2908211 RepID=UPI001F28D08D|nr:DNA-directed RNA polymerase subunit beta [Jeotgalibaca sp. MA1X17-3]UJF16555.1 DNA-directed RNA polymerase subunit beta [Jeotgalibaca sp. MA1X17-3]
MKFDFKPIITTILWIALFLLLALVLFAIGLMIGYGGLGNGETMQVFQRETWEHILDFIR